jgi:RNA polymerase sigma-70 factor (ECF subfamily)
MNDRPWSDADGAAEHVFRRAAGRLTASLLRSLGTRRIDLVEDVVQDALVAALGRWRMHGIPDAPEAWLFTTARRRAIDRLRAETVHREENDAACGALAAAEYAGERSSLDDDVALLFACALPSWPLQTSVTMMLRFVAGFSSGEIARAFLAKEDAVQQRIVRAKAALRDDPPAALGLRLPEEDEDLGGRCDAVLEAIYLMMNEGHAAGSGDSLLRRDVMDEALRLAELVAAHPRTTSPAAHAVCALGSFVASRFDARVGDDGLLLVLGAQDRSRWDRRRIARGFEHLVRAAAGDRLTRWHVEAGIAACHARAARWEETDWAEIVGLFDLLASLHPTPVVLLHRAVAIGERDGAAAGLSELDAIACDHRHRAIVDVHPPFHAARGMLLARVGRLDEAIAALRTSLALGGSEPEQEFLRRTIERLGAGRT